MSDSHKIEFPCENYPVKVLGDAGETLQTLVVEVMEEHAPGFDRTSIKVKDSGKGRYQSVSVYITATGPEQLDRINRALQEHPATKIVL